MWFVTLSSKNYAIWLIFECARGKTARKSWDLLHRSCCVAPGISILLKYPRMELPLPWIYFAAHIWEAKCFESDAGVNRNHL